MGLVTKFGKFYKAVDPGLVKINPLSERLHQVDVKIQISAIGRQKVITRDNVDVEMYVLLALLTASAPSDVRHATATPSSTSRSRTPTAPHSVSPTCARRSSSVRRRRSGTSWARAWSSPS